MAAEDALKRLLEAENTFALVGAQTIISTYRIHDVEPEDDHIIRVARVFATQPQALDQELDELEQEKRERLRDRATELAQTAVEDAAALQHLAAVL